MKILNTELEEFDFNDADNLEKFEKEITKTQKKLDELKPDGKTAAEVIRESCSLIFECFNNIFGEGTSKKVFGDKTSLKACVQAFKDLKAEKDKQDQDIVDMVGDINKEYNPNRAARRANRK